MRPVGSLPSFLILNFQPSTFYVFFNQYPLELMLQFYDVTAYIFSIALINWKKYHVESRVRIIPTKLMGILWPFWFAKNITLNYLKLVPSLYLMFPKEIVFIFINIINFVFILMKIIK